MRICSQRMTLQLDIGENAQDYSEIAKQEHLSGQQQRSNSSNNNTVAAFWLPETSFLFE